MPLSLRDIPYGLFSPEQIAQLLAGTWNGQPLTTSSPSPTPAPTPAPMPSAPPPRPLSVQPQPNVQPQAAMPQQPQGTGNTSSPTDFAGTLPSSIRSFGGFPQGSVSQGLLPGYGMTQLMNNFGIAGLDHNQLVGGGSWSGTVFNPPSGENQFKENPIPLGDTEFYDTYGNPKPITGSKGVTIRPAVPYQTTWNLQTYGGVKPPFDNIHQQAGAAMANLPPAYPGFRWAMPEMMQQSLRGSAGPNTGWTTMLGFTPGAK